MKRTLYVSNLAPSVDEGQLRKLFEQYGEVESVNVMQHPQYEIPYALVKMVAEKTTTKAYHGLNGHIIDGYHLTISYPEVDLNKQLLPKQRKFADSIAKELGETEKVPVREINAMVLLCGTSFARTILEDAHEVEERDGIMNSDGSQRRSLGGVFFYLARRRMPDEMRKIVYNRKGKMPKPEEEIDHENEEEQPVDN